MLLPLVIFFYNFYMIAVNYQIEDKFLGRVNIKGIGKSH